MNCVLSHIEIILDPPEPDYFGEFFGALREETAPKVIASLSWQCHASQIPFTDKHCSTTKRIQSISLPSPLQYKHHKWIE